MLNIDCTAYTCTINMQIVINSFVYHIISRTFSLLLESKALLQVLAECQDQKTFD